MDEENKNAPAEQSTFEEELQVMKNNLETITRERDALTRGRDALAVQNRRLLESLRGKPIPAEEKTDEFAFLDKIFNKERK